MENHNKKLSRLHNIMRTMGLAMSVFYVLMGIAILIRPEDLFNIPSRYCWPIGSIMIVYGSFRGYRFYQRYLQ